MQIEGLYFKDCPTMDRLNAVLSENTCRDVGIGDVTTVRFFGAYDSAMALNLSLDFVTAADGALACQRYPDSQLSEEVVRAREEKRREQ
jgi:hypothetical protein